MNKDPEEPNDNPLDDSQDTGPQKKQTKKPEQPNPWAQGDDLNRFRKTSFTNGDDLFSSFVKHLKKAQPLNCL